MKYEVDNGKRRANSFRMLTSTVGGKVAMGLVAALLLLAVSSPLYAKALTEWHFEGTVEGIVPEVVSAAVPETALTATIVWLVLALFAAACTFRQRNVGVVMRTNEHLILEGSILTYSFHSSGDRHSAVSRNIIMIDLAESKVSFDETQRHWVFEGGVFGHYYRFPEDEPLLSMHEMEPISRFTIDAHFDDPFDETMRAYAVS